MLAEWGSASITALPFRQITCRRLDTAHFVQLGLDDRWRFLIFSRLRLSGATDRKPFLRAESSLADATPKDLTTMNVESMSLPYIPTSETMARIRLL